MILVTGGSGYLGSHLARTLLDKGEKVRIFDVFKSPHVPDRAQFMQGDMRDAAQVKKALKGVDVVMHLAFIQSLSKRPLREKYQINIGGAETLFKEALDRKVKRFVNTSTIEIYGTSPPFPCTEEAPKDSPVGWYGRHKWEVERLSAKYLKKGLPVTHLRMPAICGPGHYNHGPMLDLMDRLIDHKPVPLPGDGSILANMTQYEDVISAYLLAAEKDAAVGEAFNISSREPATHREILQAMKEAVNSRSLLIPVPMGLSLLTVSLAVFFGVTDIPDHQVGYAFHPNHYSCEKAVRLLGYDPKNTVTDSARQQILGYLENREYVRERNRTY